MNLSINMSIFLLLSSETIRMQRWWQSLCISVDVFAVLGMSRGILEPLSDLMLLVVPQND